MPRERKILPLYLVIENHLHGHQSLSVGELLFYDRHMHVGHAVHVAIYPAYPLLSEGNGCCGGEPLAESADASTPFPMLPCSRSVLDGNLLAEHPAVLLLHERVDICSGEVLVHVHLVTEILESGHVAHYSLVPVVLSLET